MSYSHGIEAQLRKNTKDSFRTTLADGSRLELDGLIWGSVVISNPMSLLSFGINVITILFNATSGKRVNVSPTLHVRGGRTIAIVGVDINTSETYDTYTIIIEISFNPLVGMDIDFTTNDSGVIIHDCIITVDQFPRPAPSFD